MHNWITVWLRFSSLSDFFLLEYFFSSSLFVTLFKFCFCSFYLHIVLCVRLQITIIYICSVISRYLTISYFFQQLVDFLFFVQSCYIVIMYHILCLWKILFHRIIFIQEVCSNHKSLFTSC